MKKCLTLVVVLLLVTVIPVFAQPAQGLPEPTPEPNQDLTLSLKSLDQLLRGNLGTDQVLGKPVTSGDITLIPIIAKGLGFGFSNKIENKDQAAQEKGAESQVNKGKGRIGLGGGGFVRPIAVILVNQKTGHTEVIPVHPSVIVELFKQIAPALHKLVGGLVQKMQAATKMRLESMKKDGPPPPPQQ